MFISVLIYKNFIEGEIVSKPVMQLLMESDPDFTREDGAAFVKYMDLFRGDQGQIETSVYSAFQKGQLDVDEFAQAVKVYRALDNTLGYLRKEGIEINTAIEEWANYQGVPRPQKFNNAKKPDTAFGL
jgi:hypothetical protein